MEICQLYTQFPTNQDDNKLPAHKDKLLLPSTVLHYVQPMPPPIHSDTLPEAHKDDTLTG